MKVMYRRNGLLRCEGYITKDEKFVSHDYRGEGRS
jgi:hypothetical protein